MRIEEKHELRRTGGEELGRIWNDDKQVPFASVSNRKGSHKEHTGHKPKINIIRGENLPKN